MVKITQMKKTTLRQAALKLAIVAFAVLAPLGLRAQQSLPYSYGFEDNDLAAAGWTAQVTSSSSGINSQAAHEGSYGFQFNYSERNAYLVSPLLTGTDNGVALSFYYKEYSASYGDEQFYVGYTTDETVTDPSAFTYGDITTASTSWQLYEASLPAGTKRVAIKYVYNDAFYLFLDDFTFEAPASCIKPTGLAVTLTSGDGTKATFSWTENGTATQWQLCLNGDETNLIEMTENPFTYTGLTAETTYTAKVRAYCDATDQSEWSNEVTFTPTNAFSLTVNDGTTTNNCVPVFGYWADATQRSEFIIPSSQLGALNGATLTSMKFYPNYNFTSTGSFQVYLKEVDEGSFSGTNYYTDNEASVVYTGTIEVSSTNGLVITFNGDGYEYNGGNLLVGFYKASGGNYYSESSCPFYGVSATGASISHYSSYSVSQRDFLPKTTFTYVPNPTPKPRNLAVSNITSSGAMLTWEVPASATPTSYEYQYKTSTAEWPTDWTSNGTNLTVTFNTLTASNNYTFRVRAIYDGVGESDPVETSFTTLDNCAFPTNLTATTTPGQGTKATFTWVKGYDETQWVLQYATNNVFTEGLVEVTTGFITEGTTVTYNATGLTPETHYYARVKATCSATSSSTWSNVAEFTPTNYIDYTFGETSNYTSSYVPFYGYYANRSPLLSQFIIPSTELEDVAGGTIRRMTFYSSTASASWGDAEFSVYVKEVEATSFSASSAEGLEDWESMTNVYNGSLSISGNQMVIEFENNFTYNGGNLMIGFNETTTGTGASASWYYVSGSSNSTLYAYNSYSSAYYSRGSSLPKVTFNYQPTPYVKIAAINEGTITTTSAQLTWAAPETEATITGYAYQYKLSSAAEWPTTWSNLAANATSVTLEPLIAGSSYDFRIKVLYGEHESVITSKSFYTGCGVITTFPWRENFDTRSIGNFSDPCWVNEHLTVVGDNASKVFTVVTSNNENRINLLQLPDESIGNTIKLRLPQMTLPNDNYQFVLDVYRSNSTYNDNYPNEGIRVYASTDGEIEGATELTFIPRQYNVSSTLILEETAEGWYTYEIPIGISGTCYIILRGESQYCTHTYMDNLTVEEIPTCRKPKTPVCDSKTAHTATLSWTEGEEGQDAWQIAYSAEANFAPDDDFTPDETTTWLVDANTNPFTINGLNANTQYRAYVRANCGNENGVSYWSVLPANFTTLAGNLAPTAFHTTDLQAEQVGMDWTPAGNDNETSWTILLNDENIENINTVADEDLPATASMRNAGSHPTVITGLTPEHTYYAWIRSDNQADGVSSWVAITGNTFTTTALCPQPTDVVANDVTNNSATISWDGHGETEFTVRYHTVEGIDGISEEFSTTTIPTGWENKQGLLSAVLSGNASLTTPSSYSSWGFSNTYVFGAYHARLNIYGTDRKHWLITPEVILNDGANALAFDLALTDYNNADAIENPEGQADDKFAVLISIDDGTTWEILREWNNSGSEYIYNNIATAGEHVSLDLSSYSGAIKIAFYGESTESNGDNDLHIDNVAIGATIPAGEWVSVNATDATEASISPLDENTKYEVVVSPGCDPSIESTPVFFTTASLFPKEIEANKWYAIASPMHNDGNNETLAGVNNLTSGTYDLYGYNEATGTWEKPTTSLNRGKGYIYRRSNDATLQFVGDANTGSVSVSLTSSCSDIDLKGFNLIGNPYPHAVAISQPHYTLNPNGTWTAHTSNNTIGVAEACLVYSTYSSNTYYFSDVTPSTPGNSNTASASLAFTVSNGEYSDVAYARLEEGNSLRKIGHLNSEAPMLSIPVEGRRYAIANLGSDCQSFNLVFRGVNGTYTIKQSSNQAIAYCHLIDRVAGKDIDMLRQPSYTFSSNGFDADRFMVKLSPDAQENANGNFAYWNGNSWMVEGNGTLQVFDALGRQLFSQEISNSNFEIQNSLFPAAGVYVLRMGEKTQKIVVR